MRKPFNLLIVLVVILLTTSCSTIHETTKDLNDVEKSLNYWGKVAMSEPVFIENKGQFKVNFSEDGSNYVQSARNNISGASRSALETSLYLGLALQGQFTPPISTGSAASSNSTNESGGLSLPNQAESALSSFTPLLSLGSLAPAIDERQAVQKGINDKLAEQLLAFLANPDVGTNGDRKILFGVMQITCQPGQKTRHGYLADLNVSLGYGRIPPTKDSPDIDTDGIQENTTNYPGIFAVLPLVDSRNVELQNSDRSQIELASALSAAFAAKGINAAAKSLSDYVKRQESDSETRNSLPVVTSYTDGSTFGFQIYPSFQAIANPSKATAAASDILEPITFPAVVAIIIDKDGYYDTTNDGQITTNNPWNYLVSESETRWVPLKAPYFVNTSFFDGLLMDNFGKWDTSLFDRVRRGKLLDEASDNLNSLASNNVVKESYQYQQLKIARDSLVSTALGNYIERPLPSGLFSSPSGDTSKPSITGVFPHNIWRDTNTTFTIVLKGVTNSSEISGVTIAGVDCTPATTNIYAFGADKTTIETTIKIGDNMASTNNSTNTTFVFSGIAIKATLPNYFYDTTNATNSVEFVVSTTKGQPITQTFNMSMQGKIAPEAAVTVNRDASSKVLGFNIQPGQGLKGQELLDAIKDVLERSEPAPKTTTIVK